jgi:hypothetical protein
MSFRVSTKKRKSQNFLAFVQHKRNKIIQTNVANVGSNTKTDSQCSLKQFDKRLTPYLEYYYRNPNHKDYLIDLYSNGQVNNIQSSFNNLCTECNHELLYDFNLASDICTNCGFTSQHTDCTILTTCKSYELEYNSFAYKRLNHFRDTLRNIQCKNNKHVPQSVLHNIMDELYKKKIQIDNVTIEDIRLIVKQLHIREFYNTTVQIWCKITGNSNLCLHPQIEEKLVLMFISIQDAFHKVCPLERKNFLSYPYCLYKFCQLLNYKELLHFFPLLKSKKKLQQQEHIFKQICKYKQWDFISIGKI